MESQSKFKTGDSVNYRNGMDFKDFNGVVEKCIDYKGAWHYMVKDVKDNSIKRVGERFLNSNLDAQYSQRKSKFKVGDTVKFRNDSDFQFANGIVEKSINNYQGQWQYLVKDGKMNSVKRVDEKFLELISHI